MTDKHFPSFSSGDFEHNIDFDGLQRVFSRFVDDITSFDSMIHGNLSEFLLEKIEEILKTKSEYIVCPEKYTKGQRKEIDNLLNMNIASTIYRVALDSPASAEDKLQAYDDLVVWSERNGWDSKRLVLSIVKNMGMKLTKKQLYHEKMELAPTDYN